MILVIGNGITGRLVSHRLAEVGKNCLVLETSKKERSDKLTRMWGTNYLWSPLPGLPAHVFDVFTTVDGVEGTNESISRYKRKIGKPEDIGNWGLQFEYHTKGYDFHQIPQSSSVEYETQVIGIDPFAQKIEARNAYSVDYFLRYDILVSTIPLRMLVALIVDSGDYFVPHEFAYDPIWINVQKSTAPPSRDVVVNYVSDFGKPEYRRCVRDGQVHTEYLVQPDHPTVKLSPGKIHSTPHTELTRRILDERYPNIVRFGRYANWEPNELVHETDCKIREWVTCLRS